MLSSTAGAGSTLAFSESIKIPPSVWKGKTVTIKMPLYHASDYGAVEETCFSTRMVQPRVVHAFVQLKWHPFNPEKSFRHICAPVCQASDTVPDIEIKSKGKMYEDFSGYDLMQREGLTDILQMIKDSYDGDPLLPRSLSSSDPPPINRIHAIYGINLPTEVGVIYKRQDTCRSGNTLQSLYSPDKNAQVDAATGYKISGGILLETNKTKQKCDKNRQVSGDGTVPYWSLQHCKTWKSTTRLVTVQELENADHREILADSRFHEEVLRYSRFHGQTLSKVPKKSGSK
jgi:hypothetical protein